MGQFTDALRRDPLLERDVAAWQDSEHASRRMDLDEAAADLGCAVLDVLDQSAQAVALNGEGPILSMLHDRCARLAAQTAEALSLVVMLRDEQHRRPSVRMRGLDAWLDDNTTALVDDWLNGAGGLERLLVFDRMLRHQGREAVRRMGALAGGASVDFDEANGYERELMKLYALALAPPIAFASSPLVA